VKEARAAAREAAAALQELRRFVSEQPGADWEHAAVGYEGEAVVDMASWVAPEKGMHGRRLPRFVVGRFDNEDGAQTMARRLRRADFHSLCVLPLRPLYFHLGMASPSLSPVITGGGSVAAFHRAALPGSVPAPNKWRCAARCPRRRSA
jgi:hypothetical protein